MPPRDSDPLPLPAQGWTCFHCGENCRTVAAARAHFGGRPDAVPGCLLQVKYGEARGLLLALRQAEAQRDEALDMIDELIGVIERLTGQPRRLEPQRLENA
jgi:hypothetical protein